VTATVLNSDTAPFLYVVRDRIIFLGELAGSDLRLVEVEIPPGSGSPPHRHASPETFRILEGEVVFGLFASGQAPWQLTAGPGTVVRIDPWEGHNYVNMGPVPARMLVVLDKDMIGFFEDLGTSVEPEPGQPSEAEIGAIMAACGRHGIEILASPPPGP
jgi:quercetin dioxygenase-like cupin family protein